MTVINYIFPILLFLLFKCRQDHSVKVKNIQCERRIIGYVSLNNIINLHFREQQLSKLTHIIFKSFDIDAKGIIYEQTRLSKINENIKNLSNLKIIVSVIPARQFFPRNMEQNIKEIIDLFTKSGINGIEFNVENFFYMDDLIIFSKYLAEFRNMIEKLEYNFSLSIELHPKQLDSIGIPILRDFFGLTNFINLMAYHYYIPRIHNKLSIAASFAPLYPYKNGDTMNVDSTIKYLACNIPQEHMHKINLGLSFGGWKWTMLEEDANLPSHKRTKDKGLSGLPFNWRIKHKFFDINRTVFDGKIKSAYIYDGEKQEYYTFENERSILEKVKYVNKKGLGGIAIVYLHDDDDQNTLTNVIISNFNRTCDASQIENGNFTCNIIHEITSDDDDGIIFSLFGNIPSGIKLMIFSFILTILLCKLMIFLFLFERRREKKKLDTIISQLQEKYKDYKLKTMTSLGEGNFGEVHLGRFYHKMEKDEGRGKIMAYKILRQNDVKITILTEMSVMAGLLHENICKFYGLYELDGRLCILMEYANLGNLLSYLQQRWPSEMQNQNPPALLSFELLNISAMIAKGLRYLEEKRILHRDLAARNCLVSGNDDHGIESANMRPPIRVMLSDFGLSKKLKESSSFYQPVLPCFSMSEQMQPNLPLLRQFGEDELARRYMAPESLKSSEFTFKSEIWSFGMVLFEVFTCKTPFGMLDEEDVTKKIRRGEHPEIPPNLPDEIKEIMKRCWLVDPKERINIGEICEKLGV